MARYTAAVYILLGVLPIEATIHQAILSLIGAVVRADGSTVNNLGRSLLSTGTDLPKTSWFRHVENLLQMYDLPGAEDLEVLPGG